MQVGTASQVPTSVTLVSKHHYTTVLLALQLFRYRVETTLDIIMECMLIAELSMQWLSCRLPV